MRRRRTHTGNPDCPTCSAAVGAAGARAFREARAQARAAGLGRGAHVPGQHPVADHACEASARAEAAVAVCYALIGAQEGAAADLSERLLAALPGPAEQPIPADGVAARTGASRRRVGDLLRELVMDHVVDLSGEGRRGAPYLYRRSAQDSRSAAQGPLRKPGGSSASPRVSGSPRSAAT